MQRLVYKINRLDMDKLSVARVLVVLGFLIGLISWWATVRHIGDPTYMLTPAFTSGATHAWYHAFREAAGDAAAMLVILFIFFGRNTMRTAATWFICLILMVGYYAPFWVGAPFIPELSAPNWQAELIHILMAAFPMLGLFLASGAFFSRPRS